MLLPKSSWICMPSFRSVAPIMCWQNYHFWPFFSFMRTQEEYGHIYVLKHSSDETNSEYVLVHGSNSQGLSIIPE